MLYFLMLLTGGVLAAQCLLISSYAGPVSITGIGTLSTDALVLFLLQVVALCIVLILLAVLAMRPKFTSIAERFKAIMFLPLIVGSLLAVEGLVSVNLSNAIITGISPSVSTLVGIQLFCLGILSISSYIAAPGGSYLFKSIPNYVVLLFFILLLPAAFLISD